MKIGLALSGGGALGAAHIGTVKQLEKHNIKTDAICGCSAGAIVGLLYAAGGGAAIDAFFCQTGCLEIFSPKNILKARHPDKIFHQIEDLLRQIITAKDIKDLRIKFSCVATNLQSGKADILNSGDPIKAVLASAAYPGVFPVQVVNGKQYIDGGTNLNLPVSPLRQQKMDFIIASSLYQLSTLKSHKITRVGIASRALEIMEQRINDQEQQLADFVFAPPIKNYYWYNFSQMPKIYQIGETYSSRKINQLIKKIK